jgi:hypothetical protein
MIKDKKFYVIQRTRENGRRKTVNVASGDCFKEMLETLHRLETERTDAVFQIKENPVSNWE